MCVVGRFWLLLVALAPVEGAWKNRSCGFCVCESLEMDADASVPLPKSVARQLNPFHRLMRSYKLGLVGMLLVTSALAAEPLVTVAPTLVILTWLGAAEMRNMQRFFDLTTGWYMAIIVVSVSNRVYNI